ncbi:hypothetical protein [Caulobacter sp.]|uniref:hypothetical protein n=1 Tax=Caulobacter sp. TaxID=78 RepID=UPI0031DE9711
MTLVQALDAPRPSTRANGPLMAMALASLLLVAVIAALVALGVQRAPAHDPAPAPTIVKARDPACLAALDKARDTQGLPAGDAIALSTAMLKACGVK